VESQDSNSSTQEDLYLVHRVLADFPQAYAALREAFRVRDAVARPAEVCSRCKCELESESG
jgi:hypothetical protein